MLHDGLTKGFIISYAHIDSIITEHNSGLLEDVRTIWIWTVQHELIKITTENVEYNRIKMLIWY